MIIKSSLSLECLGTSKNLSPQDGRKDLADGRQTCRKRTPNTRRVTRPRLYSSPESGRDRSVRYPVVPGSEVKFTIEQHEPTSGNLNLDFIGAFRSSVLTTAS